jgi:uncharacterized membrane protein YjgN (DUF898 family)
MDLLLGPEGRGLPWERRPEFGFWKGLLATLKLVLLNPIMAFRAMHRDGRWGPPLVFALLVGTAAFVVVGLRQAIRGGPAFELLEWLSCPVPGAGTHSSPVEIALPLRVTVSLLAAPLLALAPPLASALAAQLCLRLLGQRPGRLRLTAGVLLYAYTATALLCVVPVCGAPVFALWYGVVAAIGLAVVHRARPLAALAAALALPLAIMAALTALLLALQPVLGASGA